MGGSTGKELTMGKAVLGEIVRVQWQCETSENRECGGKRRGHKKHTRGQRGKEKVELGKGL